MDNAWEGLIARFRRDYFSDPERRMHLQAGATLMEQDAPNERLYFVISGRFVGTIRAEDDLGEEQQVEVFEAAEGDFLGVNSFFSWTGHASTRVTAVTNAELAWIDHQTQPVEPERYGGIRKQFVPLIVEESSRRQLRLIRFVREREAAMRRLHLVEQYSTLGRLAAGLAHELNNAVGVMEHASEQLVRDFQQLLQRYEPGLAAWFERGLASGQTLSSDQVRRRARQLMQRHAVSYDVAKELARMGGEEELTELPEPLEEGATLWQAGRDFHDMRLAARHAAAIVRSVKQLGGGGRQREEGVDINATLQEALALLQSDLRQVAVVFRPDPDLPPIWGNASELVQMWANIIKNGWDALKEAQTPDPRLTLSALRHGRGVEVVLANNGPQIPEALRARLFQPNITTKHGTGTSMGLGLGLYIVKRLVDSYNGELLLESEPHETRFIIRLPLRHKEIDIPA